MPPPSDRERGLIRLINRLLPQSDDWREQLAAVQGLQAPPDEPDGPAMARKPTPAPRSPHGASSGLQRRTPLRRKSAMSR